MSLETNHDAQAPLKFASWVPDVSGGLVVSKTEQRTDRYFAHGNTPEGITEQIRDVRESAQVAGRQDGGPREVLPIVRELEAADLAKVG